MARMKVIIESPYAGDVERNVRYARRAMLDSLQREEAPLLSHLLYTQVLNDLSPEEREMGIEAGLSWYCVADFVIFYCDYGMSPGMLQASARAIQCKILTMCRFIGKE